MKLKVNTIIYIFVLLILMGASAETIKLLKYNQEIVYPSLFEITIIQLNDINKILFNFTFILLLFSINYKKNYKGNISLILLKNSIVKILLFMFILFIANIIFILVNQGFNNLFSNYWTYDNGFENIGFSPVLSFLISIILAGLRFIFTIYLLYGINYITKKSYWGFWAILLISVVDFQSFAIQHQSKFLPIDHSTLIYSKSMIVQNANILQSIIYWLIMILIIYYLIFIINKIREIKGKSNYE